MIVRQCLKTNGVLCCAFRPYPAFLAGIIQAANYINFYVPTNVALSYGTYMQKICMHVYNYRVPEITNNAFVLSYTSKEVTFTMRKMDKTLHRT